MARTSDPDSATSQFFINTSDNSFLDYPGQDILVTVFLVKSLKVLMLSIKLLSKTGSQNGHQDVPVEPVLLRK